MKDQNERLIETNMLIDEFVDKLISDTESRDLQWFSLFDYTHGYDISDLTGFEYVLFHNEFHEMDYVNSYICESYHFVIVILVESFLSGKDSSISHETNVYVSKDRFTHPEILNVSRITLNKLINAASESHRKLSDENIDSVPSTNQLRNIMKSYLSSD